MKEGSALKDHFDALNSTLMDLKNVKVKTDDEDVASSIVTSQPQSVGLSATGATGATRATRVTGPDWVHIEHTKAKEKSRPREPNPQDTFVDYKGTPLIWIMDSACSFNMSSNRDWIVTYKEFDGERDTSNVRHVPDLKNVLISRVLDLKGFKYTNEDGVLRVSKGALVVMKETKGTSSLYTLQVETITRSQRKVLNENQTGKKIYRLRIDNGLEFCSRDEERLDPRAKKGIFIGYENGVKGYRILSPSERRVVLSRDATFKEDYLFHVKQDSIESKLGEDVSQKVEYVLKKVEHVVPRDMDHVVTSSGEEVESLAPATYREAITSKEFHMWSAANLFIKTRVNCIFGPCGMAKLQFGKIGNTPSSKNFRLSTAPQSEAQIEHMSRIPYASSVESLMYVMVCTRSDTADATSVVSRYMAHPGKEHSNAVKRSFAVFWKATLQPSVALSTTKAEYMALAEVAKEGTWLKCLIEDLGFSQDHQDQATVFCDSMNAICLAKDQVYHDRTKHIDVLYHFIRTFITLSALKEESK
ncbi:retrovirus-related pol polyprotein from transposon TNT 1-94 [Tanacetum coccineum]